MMRGWRCPIRDTELYRALLGLDQPWMVARVELDMPGQRVEVFVEHPAGERFACPVCAHVLAVYDHSDERIWRHLDSMQFMTYLHARPPRVQCPTHGVRQVRLPWAEPLSRFTLLFERLAIEVLLAAGVQGARRVLRISWDEAWHLQERAVKRGQAAKGQSTATHLGVDEKAAGRGQDYLTIVCDLQRGVVEHVAEGRKEESLGSYFEGLSVEQKTAIAVIAMDMWRPFFNAAIDHVPDGRAKVVFDRFHIMSYVSKALDEVRSLENAQLRRQGNDALAGSRYLWLYAEENVPERRKAKFEALRAADLKTARAWALKENLRALWRAPTRAAGQSHWEHWYAWAIHSQLRPIAKVAATIKRHLGNVLSYFDNRVTNAVSEGLNSKIQTIKKMAYGYRNKKNFRTAIYFHCGGLALSPAASTHGEV